MQRTHEVKFDYQKFAALLEGSVAENARKLGISRQHLNNIKNGNKNPSADLLLKMQHVFGMSAENILRHG